ncbi:MAG: DivIVA domain-containing protein [Ferrimicrobium sp.]|uniref:Cell wall synthesis protein Wag31 n=1 Tax=Ferrimicrobium acidiphilum TaxID=121039 RepID=A0ABV3Y118_9ACTN|nr:DivIVA domain-containing protein [Ferrimicrobium sp.]
MEGNTVDAQRIREVEFRERMRGYHQEDVDEFLEQVAKGVEVLESQLAQAHEELARLKVNPPTQVLGRSEDFGDDVIQRTLIVAQKAADQLREDAEKEAREVRAEAQRQAERILSEARTTSRLIEEERRKNLLEELAQLEEEFARRQEQLSNIMKRDRAVRQRITDEIGGLLSLVRAADAAVLEPDALGGARTEPSEDLRSRGSDGTGSAPAATAGFSDSDVADEVRGGVQVPGDVPAADTVEPTPGDARPVQEFVFGHDISAGSADDEPFMLWRQDE